MVNTCDAYRDAWPMFFYILQKTWQGEMPKIYMNCEKEKYEVEGLNITVLNCRNKSMAWGQRLIEALNRIESDYVLMMLEDFYYEQPIKVDIIERCLKWIQEDESILSFQLVPAGEVYYDRSKAKKETYPGFLKRERKGSFTFIAGPTLWRKADIVALTMNSDTPWEWEFFGSMRTRLYGKKVYCWRNDMPPIFDYDIAHGGVIHRGRWVGYKVKELEKKYEYVMDYGDREIVEDWMKEPLVNKRRRTLGSILYNRSRPAVDIVFGLWKRIKRY